MEDRYQVEVVAMPHCHREGVLLIGLPSKKFSSLALINHVFFSLQKIKEIKSEKQKPLNIFVI